MNSYCIQDYLSEIDLKGYDSLHAFWRELDSKYPRAEVKLLEHAYARLEEGDEESFITPFTRITTQPFLLPV